MVDGASAYPRRARSIAKYRTMRKLCCALSGQGTQARSAGEPGAHRASRADVVILLR